MVVIRCIILLSYSVVVVLLLLLSLLLLFMLLTVRVYMCVYMCMCMCVCACQGAGGSELPLTATHIYNRTENKTTAVTYKVSISIHQYWRFILSLARSNALAHTFHAGAALFQTDLWVRPILRARVFARASRNSPNRHADSSTRARRRKKKCKVRESSRISSLSGFAPLAAVRRVKATRCNITRLLMRKVNAVAASFSRTDGFDLLEVSTVTA